MIADDDLFVVIVDDTNDGDAKKVIKKGNIYKPKPFDDKHGNVIQNKQEVDYDDKIENILYAAKEHGEILHLKDNGDVEGTVSDSEIDVSTSLFDDNEPQYVCRDESSDSSQDEDSEYKGRTRKSTNWRNKNRTMVSYVEKLKETYPKLRKNEKVLIKILTHKMKETRPPDPPLNYATYDGSYRCNMCRTESPLESIAIRHYQERHGERYLCCYACGAMFRSTNALYTHERANCLSRDIQVVLKARALSMKRRGKSRLLVPDQCKDPPKRSKHTIADKNKSSDGPFLCSICPRMFTSPLLLSRHVRKHDNCFTCDYCNKSFKLKGKLVAHMDIHAPKKKFGCEECPKRFASKANLMVHVNRDHRQLPPPLQCKICPKRFVRMTALKRHMRSIHGMAIITPNMLIRRLPKMTEKQAQLQHAIVVLKNPATPSNVKENL